MTPSTCWRRVSRLQELGVVKRRVALLDREKIGLNVMVFSHVKLSGHGRDALLKFEQAVREHPEKGSEGADAVFGTAQMDEVFRQAARFMLNA